MLSDQAWHEEALPKAHIISPELHKPLQANNMTKNMASLAFLRDAAAAPTMAPRNAMIAHKTFVEKQYPSKHCTPNCSPSAGYPSPDRILCDHSLQDQALPRNYQKQLGNMKMKFLNLITLTVSSDAPPTILPRNKVSRSSSPLKKLSSLEYASNIAITPPMLRQLE